MHIKAFYTIHAVYEKDDDFYFLDRDNKWVESDKNVHVFEDLGAAIQHAVIYANLTPNKEWLVFFVRIHIKQTHNDGKDVTMSKIDIEW